MSQPRIDAKQLDLTGEYNFTGNLLIGGVSALQDTFSSVAGDSGSYSAVSDSDTLTIAGGSGILTSVAGGTLTIDIGSPLVILNSVALSGYVQFSDIGTGLLSTGSPQGVIVDSSVIPYLADANTFSNTNTFSAVDVSGNIQITGSGWAIFPNRIGAGMTPNKSAAVIQATGDIQLTGGVGFFEGTTGSPYTIDNVIYQSGSGTELFTRVRNYSNVTTLWEVRSQAGTIGTVDREATISLVRTDDGSNEEYLDLFNNGYFTGGSPSTTKISQSFGIRIQKRGTGSYRPFYIDWYDGTTVTDGLNLMSPDSPGGPYFQFKQQVKFDSSATTFSGTGGTISNSAAALTGPGVAAIHFNVSGQGTDLKNWYAGGNGSEFVIAARNDTESTSNNALAITRSTDTPLAAVFTTTMAWGGGSAISSSDDVVLTTGSQSMSGTKSFTQSTSVASGTYPVYLYSTGPGIGWNRTSNTTDNKRWDFGVYSDTYLDLRVAADDGSSIAYAMRFERSGVDVTNTNISSELQWGGGSAISSSDNVALLDAANTFTNNTGLTVSSAAPSMVLHRTSLSSGNVSFGLRDGSSGAYWNMMMFSGSDTLVFYGSTAGSALTIDSSGNFNFEDGTVTTSNSSSSEVGFKGIPGGGAKTSDYTLASGDQGKYIYCEAGVSNITVPSSVFYSSGGDVVMVVNETGGSITIVQGSGMTMYLTGTATTGNRTLADHGIATIFFSSASQSYCSGGGVT